jgi:4-amino-4-deoxy-L-arabinose transferase-like glycosyltransferase
VRGFTPRRQLWLVALLTLAAFALRLTDLTARSLWLDESFSVLRAQGTWAEMVANVVWRQGIFTTDLNPPLYFALLKAWVALAGLTDFTLKLFSAFWAVLIVPLTYVLARRFFGSWAGVLAALFALLCPAYQWYAAEVRMYSMMACLGAASVYALFKACSPPQRGGTRGVGRLRWLAIWLIGTTLALFTHFSFIALILTQAVFLLIWALPRVRRLFASPRAWLGVIIGLAVVVVGAFVLGGPTLMRMTDLASQALTGPSGRGVAVAGFLQEILGAALFGLNAADPTGGLLLWVMALLALVGVILPLNRIKASERLLLTLVIVVPIAFWVGLSFLLQNSPSVRYVIYIFPALHVLVARGVLLLFGAIGSPRPALRWAGPVTGCVALLAIIGSSLHGMVMAFTRTPTFQDDWRGMAGYLRQNWQPGDAVLINLNTPEAVLPLYWRDLPLDILTAQEQVMDRPGEVVRGDIEPKYRRVWFANTGGDGGYQNAESQAALSPYVMGRRASFPARTTTLELIEYDVHAEIADTLPKTATAVEGGPEGTTHLAGFEIAPGNPYNTNANFLIKAYWRRGSDDPIKHGLTVRLKRDDGLWLDWTLNAQLKAHPETWTEGQFFRRSYLVPVPPGLPIQPYQLELLVRTGDKGEVAQSVVLPLSDDDVACCLRVPDWPHGGDVWRSGDATLAIAEFAASIRPGQPLPVALTWRPGQSELPPWQTELRLDGLLGGEVASVKRDAGTQDAPPGTWPANELTRDQYTLPQVSYATAPGLYRLSLNRLRDGRAVDGTSLGLVRVEDYPRTAVATAIQHRVNAKVGETALLGYTAPAPAPFERGQTYDVVTHWRVDAQPQRDGKLFLHVLSADGKPVSQDDNAPFRGERSTLTFRPGDGIDQVHRIALPVDLPAGEYVLWAGVYNSDDGARWPAQQDGQPALNDLVRLGSFTLP